MILDDQHWLSLVDSFQAAAFGRTDWYGALDNLAEATGSAHGQLIGLGADAAVPFNVVTKVDAGHTKAFAEAGGGNPLVNPRVNAGMNASVLQVLAESDFITPDEYKRNAHYQEFAVPMGIPYICLTTLERRDGMLIGLAVLRDKEQGHITDRQRHAFSSLAPHVRAAVRTQLALEGDGAALLVGAMEALSIPAFVCDRAGLVRALSPAAENLIAMDRGLKLKLGCLRAINPVDNKALVDAVNLAARGAVVGEPPLLNTVIIRHGPQNELSMVLDVIALPARQFEFSFAPRVLVLARGERGRDGRRAALLQAAYALTSAETDIAIQICDGKSPEEIAEARGVSVGTVRIQIKSILAKLGVKRQVELVARVSQL